MGQRAFSRYAVELVQPDFIPSLEKAKQQVLWLGCSDSGYEETTMLDLLPEEMIVVRNIGNMALSTDLAWASAVQYAIDALQVVPIPEDNNHVLNILLLRSSTSLSADTTDVAL
jgi:carbonic anhydrase